MNEIKLGKQKVGISHKPYFIADIAANHDGELSRAKDLVWIAKEAGADCAKFQHFLANKIVNDVEFKKIESVKTHQSEWKKSVSEIYDHYHFRREWTQEIYNECQKAKIEFSTSPYDYDAVEEVIDYVNFLKIGSGDITWKEILVKIAKKKKPVLLACGASTLKETIDAVQTIRKYNKKIILMHCNTNYTNDPDNLNFINLNALNQFNIIFNIYTSNSNNKLKIYSNKIYLIFAYYLRYSNLSH